ncbi:MAG: translation elongation factor Ts [Firmicutes bacterium]|nr:translation elongation factor Ts [Bacillota bacterium]
MAFTAQDVAKLREMTGVGMMDCKKALTAVDGDMAKAAEYLREQGMAVAAKKADRIASEGAVVAAVSTNKKVGALVEVNCESDFVGKNPAFIAVADAIAKVVVKENPKDNDALLAAKTGKTTVLDLINEQTTKIGEKLSLRRFVRFEINNGYQETYLHMGGKIGVLLEVATDKELAKDKKFVEMTKNVAMHIAAMNPSYTYETEVPASEVEKEKEILLAQVANDEKNKGKPAQVVENIVKGKIKKYFKEICLVEQEYVKDSSMNVGSYVASIAKEIGADIKLVKFVKFMMGEGLEKKSDNLAEEVAKMQNK